MKTLLNKWFMLGCLIWITVLIMRRTGHPVPGLNGYINDLVAVPVIANLGLWFQRVFLIGNNYYVLAPWHVMFIVVYLTVAFEIILPHYSKIYTADLLDALLYAAGGIFFYKIINDPIMTRSTKKYEAEQNTIFK